MEEKLASLLAQVTEAGGTPVQFAVPASAEGAPSEYEGVPVVQPEDQTVFALVFNDASGETQIATLKETANMSGGEAAADDQPSE
jgi:hypothetical protein